MKRSNCPCNNDRGLILGIVILSSIMFSAASLAVLNLSATSSHTANQQANRLRARYAAEAGLVWAMQRLWVTPSECFTANPDFSLDPDGNGPLPVVNVDITATPCPSPTVNEATLTATVVNY